ncbi:MAG: hypothetical protein IPJ98_19500 [Bryobacterales bacterium]|nr:hypothetical protein [Bryobacterales bacterium]
MTVRATRLLRKMRGGAQSHLFQADDGHFYVVKFANNPQHRRILVNEWLAARFLSYLQLAAPEPAIVEIPAELLAAEPRVHMTRGGERVEVTPGRHYGSRYPGDPDRMTVYDFLPDVLLHKVSNQRDFLGMVAFDKWMGNSDARQAVFFRGMAGAMAGAIAGGAAGDGAGEAKPRPVWAAWMIDHGYVFDGLNWEFIDAPLSGLYFRPLYYEAVRGMEDFEPWLDRIAHFPEHVVDEAWRTIPEEWLTEEDRGLEKLLERLLRRRGRVEPLIEDVRRAKATLFPNWT